MLPSLVFLFPFQRLAAQMLIQIRFTLENDSDEIDFETLEKIKTTMAGVRDPAFWRRFSMAVHMDEEKGTGTSDAEKSQDMVMVQHT